MADFEPNNLVLRCYGYQTKEGNWYGTCLDLNIAVEEKSSQLLKVKMKQAIESYIETVLDTTDKDSIPVLLSRKASLKDRIIYDYIRIIASFNLSIVGL